MQYLKEAIEVANGMLDGTVGLLDGSVKLASLRHRLNMSNDSSFLVFAAIDSEADNWPNPSKDASIDSEYLARAESEKSIFLNETKPEIYKACQEVLEKAFERIRESYSRTLESFRRSCTNLTALG